MRCETCKDDFGSRSAAPFREEPAAGPSVGPAAPGDPGRCPAPRGWATTVFVPPPSPATGGSDFLTLRRRGAPFVDKSAFIIDTVVHSGSPVQLFCRPRRFGRTLNLSMLRYFLERSDEDLRGIWDGLAVWSDERARAEFQQHPVIWLSFKDVKGRT